MHIAGHVLEHSVADTLYIIPFLFVTYLAMEWLEHKTGGRAQAAIQRAGAAGVYLRIAKGGGGTFVSPAALRFLPQLR